MKYRRLGRSGLMISELVLGTMNLGRPTGRNVSDHFNTSGWM
jgi:aryl-alcohol dehydrogenase-like predicted oxidoreductase